MKKMSFETKNEYIAVQRRRYSRAGKPYKTRLPDEVCEVCGMGLQACHQTAQQLVEILHGQAGAQEGVQLPGQYGTSIKISVQYPEFSLANRSNRRIYRSGV